ncbi:hypothetical protein PCANC_17271 [Puccinia coronata f. sp. avenae]|uniref:Uncharacterized protein n=1 Tax=Puccinia coronata f. sp. avenae TaxID=200324 RepID=A0A2N5UXR9_9BASI|nr:hypothetical protein PCANC_18141 [Puccinia coronata f. sp. avenae]PLW32580.1 hypothetical protein PCANC_17271 [Puccinia coronata f. sp. avenae]PLW42558.1 hypothetical protein PCASD_05255 [Puccinia coronata f. sp. avenae]
MKHADAGTARPRWPRHSALQPLLKHPTALGQHPALIQHLHLTSPSHSHGTLHLYGTHTYKGLSSLLVLLHKQQMSVDYLRSPSLLFDSENLSKNLRKNDWFQRPQISGRVVANHCKSAEAQRKTPAGTVPSLQEPPDQLAIYQVGRRASQLTWHYTSLAGEPPDQLALHQLAGKASRPAGTTPDRRESPPTSWHYTSLQGKPPDQLALHQIGGRASRQAGTTPAQRESFATS